MPFEFKLPDIGEGVHEGEIVRWLVKSGDAIAEDQPLVEVMTDKVTAEIPSPISGTIKERRGEEGDVIQVGSVIAIIEEGAGRPGGSQANPDQEAANKTRPAPPTQPAAHTAPTKPASQSLPSTQQKSSGPNQQVLAAPATRKLARELGVDLETLSGTGDSGRITQDDVRRASQGQIKPSVSQAHQSPSTTATAKPAPKLFNEKGESREPYTPLRRKIAERLVQSKQTAPHFAYVEEVDVTELVALRDTLAPAAEAEDVRLSYLPFVIQAVVAGFKKYPVLNSRLDEGNREIVYFKDTHMGIAVSTDAGLVVPVIRNADQKGLLTLARDIASLADKARRGKLAIEEIQGGTFTISSIGSIGGLFGIPIINYPEVAILGVNKIEKRPVVRTIDGEDRIVIRSILNLSISCDHRVVDGAEAALFIKEVAACLETPGRLLLAD